MGVLRKKKKKKKKGGKKDVGGKLSFPFRPKESNRSLKKCIDIAHAFDPKFLPLLYLSMAPTSDLTFIGKSLNDGRRVTHATWPSLSQCG
jgi:hypothetical protein